MNIIGAALIFCGSVLLIFLGFSALILLHRSEQIRLRFFGSGAGIGIIVLAAGWLILSGIAIESFILLCLGVVLLRIFIPKRVSHPLHRGHP